MESGKGSQNLVAEAKQEDNERQQQQQRDLAHLNVDGSIHGRNSRSPQPPRTAYTCSLRPTITTRPIAPAPIQNVPALSLPTASSQSFIQKPVLRIKTELPLISGVPTSLVVCHPQASVPRMTVPVTSATLESLIRPSNPIQQGSINPGHIPQATITTSYSTHVPRGAAAVASMTPPRAAVATPIIRAQTISSSTVHAQLQPRSSTIRTLPVTPSLPIKMTSAPFSTESLRPRGMAGTLTAIHAHLRPGEQIRPVVCASVNKPVHVSQPVVSTLQQLPDKGYYKPHLNPNLSVAPPVVMPLQQQSTISANTSTTIVTAPHTAHPSSSATVHSLPTQLVKSPLSVSKIIPQPVHTVPPIPTQQQPQTQHQQIVTKQNVHGSQHLSTSATPAVPRMTTAASIPVAKVHPQQLPTRNLEEGSGTVNLLMSSHHATPTNQTTGTGSVGTASVVLVDPQERTGLTQSGTYTTYYYEPYQNTITMSSYGSGPTTFSTLPPGSTIRVPSHPSQNISGAVQNASRSANVSPLMVTVEPGRPLTLHTNYPSGAESIVTTCEPAVASTVPQSIYAVNTTSGNYSGSQTGNCNPTSSVSSSPRPSILRKRTSEGLSVVRKNLMSSMPNSEPPTSPRPDSSSSNTTVSATTSPKPLNEQNRENGFAPHPDDKVTPATVIKIEPLDVAEAVNSSSNGIPSGIETTPRKKPRKQQLTGNELVEAHSTDGEEEFEKESKNIKKEVIRQHDEGVPLTHTRPRPPISLINTYRHTWKSRHNHFVHYTDVKAKEERRPNISDLANQKGMLQKLNGWKIHHLSAQLDEVVDEEDGVFKRLTDFLSRLEDCDRRDNSRETNGVSELIKGNLQRCRIIRDQMKEAKQQVLKVVEHKPHIIDILGRYVIKKPTNRRDKF